MAPRTAAEPEITPPPAPEEEHILASRPHIRYFGIARPPRVHVCRLVLERGGGLAYEQATSSNSMFCTQ